MKSIDSGGSFFPRPDLGKAHFDDMDAYPGITIRDWFAGQALTGLIAAYADGDSKHAKNTGIEAYLFADAMIAARSTPPVPHET